MIICDGCLEEIKYGLRLQEYGFTVGLEEYNKHYFVFAFDKKGKLVVQ